MGNVVELIDERMRIPRSKVEACLRALEPATPWSFRALFRPRVGELRKAFAKSELRARADEGGNIVYLAFATEKLGAATPVLGLIARYVDAGSWMLFHQDYGGLTRLEYDGREAFWVPVEDMDADEARGRVQQREKAENMVTVAALRRGESPPCPRCVREAGHGPTFTRRERPDERRPRVDHECPECGLAFWTEGRTG